MSERISGDDIVIVGMACRYAEATSHDQLWQNVMSARRSFRNLPAQRLPLADYGGANIDQTYVTRAAVIDDWVFDRQRFRVPGATFRAVDLTHWLALEVSAAALADAGLPDGDGLDRDRTGVVIGNSLTGEFSRAATLRVRWPYVRRTLTAALAESGLPAAAQLDLLADMERRYKAPFPPPSEETLAGTLSNTIAGRICNHFDLHGTGYTVDAACASSLVAVVTAADAIAAGRLDMALAGGVDLSLDPLELVGFARVGALATGDMRVYDSRPTGFLPGEGCGIVVLCRAAYADRHGLRPYARLMGWATSTDGSGGLTRPELAGQRLALRSAYRHAGIDPADIALVEGHGTGTEVGDAVELQALLEIRGTVATPAALGSIKANIGHTKAAAAVAGLIKAVSAIHNQVLPPTTGCEQPHQLLTGSRSLEITTQPRAWPQPQRYASLSAMGFGGINAHLVLGGITPSARPLTAAERTLGAPHPDREVVVCTAATTAEMTRTLSTIRDAARQMTRGELTDLAASLAAAHTSRLPVRFATAVASPDELADAAGRALDQLAAGKRCVIDRNRRTFLVAGKPLRVGLLFSGQSSPVYPDAGVLGELLPGLPNAYAHPLAVPDHNADTSIAQPAIVRASLAGLRWLDAIGVRAHQALGHSLGEIAALVWAGALSEDQAYAFASARGAAMAAVDGAGTTGMASIGADPETVGKLVADGPAVIAADNGPGQVVVSGTRDAIAAVIAAAARLGFTAMWLPVRHAFHSPHMQAAGPAVRSAAGSVNWRTPQRPVVSTITGDWWGQEDPVELLVRQLTVPVEFRTALARLDVELMVEVGPGHVLAGLTGENAISMDVGARSADGLATATAALFAAGAAHDVRPYFAGRFSRTFDPARERVFLSNPCELDAPAASINALPATALGSTQAAPSNVPAIVDPADALQVVVALVAAAAELDPASIQSDAALLSDLHLSSLRVVQLAAEVAAVMHRALPGIPLSLATATVAELAKTIDRLPPESGDGSALAGVGPWVRPFVSHLEARLRPQAPAVRRDWEIVGAAGAHQLADAIGVAFHACAGAVATRVLALPPGLALPVADIVAALRASNSDGRPLVVIHHRGVGAAIGRSLAVERPDVPVLVIDTPADVAGIAVAAAESERSWTGFEEVVYRTHELRTTPVARPLAISPRHDAAIPLAPGDVCLVTGGAKGIGLVCAQAIARATRARLVLVGRSGPEDVAVRAALVKSDGDIPEPVYLQLDVTDTAAVSACVGTIRDQYGPIRMLVHAAGRNEPALLGELTEAKLTATLAPKTALDALVGALEPSELRAAVTFGSVIGSTGLPGEADYAIANEWMARRCAELSISAPATRWCNIEWSAWLETGMGVELGSLDALVRQGLSPIPVDAGTDILLRILATPTLPPTVLVSGRLPGSPTMPWSQAALSDLTAARFLETERAHTPGVELIADASLSLGTDPYLLDHRIDGVTLLPAVFGLEAMAQASAALGTKPLPAVFEQVELTHPISVPERGSRIVRVAALAGDDSTEVVLRSDETRFGVEHFRAIHRPLTDDAPKPVTVRRAPFTDAAHHYGTLFFHGERFQRVRGYHGLGAYHCTASIATDPEARWYDTFHEQRLELGDPGARDAVLHALQACVPDRRVLPVGVERVTLCRRPEGVLMLDARQRGEDDDGYVFDVTVTDQNAEVVELWSGLRLRQIEPRSWGTWPMDLLGPYLTRSLRRWHPQAVVDFAVTAAGPDDIHRIDALASWLVGADVVGHQGAGLSAAGLDVGVSHLGESVVLAAAPHPVSLACCQIEPDTAPSPSLEALAHTISGRVTEPQAHAAGRARTVTEVAGKLGLEHETPIVVSATGPDRWLRLSAGGRRFYSIAVAAEGGPIAVTVGW